MCRTLTALVVFLFVATIAAADDTKDKPSEAATKFEELKKDYNEAVDAYEKLRKAGKTEEAKAALERNNPHTHLEKMLELAFFSPTDAASFDILHFIAVNAESDTYLWDQVMVRLRSNHAANPKMKHVVRLLVKHTDETADLLRALITTHPDKKVAARACALLLDYVGPMARAAEEVTEKPFLKPLMERRAGADYLKRILTDLEKNQKEVKEVTELLADKYKGVLPDLSEGKPLPDVVVEDLAGKKVKLSDLHGKVLVLYILATTDNHATIITDHQRELSKKYADKPLAILNVFVDEKKEAVTEFLKKNGTPWTNSWAGAKDNLLEDWGLPATPATFTLDAKGVIRYRDRYRGTLDDVLPDLLKDAEKK
jgi:peroxiredoxin/soluble cytochrome b562